MGVHDWPIPSGYVSDPLGGERDGERIGELARWLKAAERIDGASERLTDPLNGRSKAIIVELQEGRKAVIRPAWTCSSLKEASGATSTSCTPVPNRISVTGPDAQAYFAISAELYEFVNKGYLAWMPDVKPYEVPQELRAGTPFKVVGHGARTEKVQVELRKGDDVLWQKAVAVHDGEWQAEGVAPAGTKAGDYEWHIDEDGKGHGGSVTVAGP